MASKGIRKVWCWTFTQHANFYPTSYVTDMNYITDVFSSTYLYQPIHWCFTRILTFLSEQRALFSPIFASRAFHNMIWSQHSNVQVSIFVTYLNFADTGFRLWQLYVAFVMTWYLAFKTSGRTAKAVRPVISGNLVWGCSEDLHYDRSRNLPSNPPELNVSVYWGPAQILT